MKKVALLAIASVMSTTAFAQVGSKPPQGSPENYAKGAPTFGCVANAANYQGLPVELLLAVNSVERGKTGQYVPNSNGTNDTGAFQINSIHYKRAGRYGATKVDLAEKGCYNAQFAAMLVKEALEHPKKQSLDFFQRASGYHSWTPKYNAIYRKKLEKYTHQWRNVLDKKGYPLR